MKSRPMLILRLLTPAPGHSTTKHKIIDLDSLECSTGANTHIRTPASGHNTTKHKIIDLDSLQCSTEANTTSTDTNIRQQSQQTQNHRFGQLWVRYWSEYSVYGQPPKKAGRACSNAPKMNIGLDSTVKIWLTKVFEKKIWARLFSGKKPKIPMPKFPSWFTKEIRDFRKIEIFDQNSRIDFFGPTIEQFENPRVHYKISGPKIIIFAWKGSSKKYAFWKKNRKIYFSKKCFFFQKRATVSPQKYF